MSDVKAARKKVKDLKAKMNAAEKRMKQAKKTGSEKQQALAEKQFKTWKNRYLRAMVELKRVKEANPTNVPYKKIGIGVGLFLLAAGLKMYFSGDGEASDDTAADNL